MPGRKCLQMSNYKVAVAECIMTKNSNGQIVVHTKDEILYWFEQTEYQDGRINAYPAFLSKAEERGYDKGINLN
jgi:hypothetical protein